VCVDWLGAGRFRDRIPRGGVEVFRTRPGPWGHTALYTVRTESSPEMKRQGCGLDYPPGSNVEVNDRQEPLCACMAYSGAKFNFLNFMLPMPCILSFPPYQPTNALNEIQ
jgi:hypothetical protein